MENTKDIQLKERLKKLKLAGFFYALLQEQSEQLKKSAENSEQK